MTVKEALKMILTRFENGEIPEAVALTCFPRLEIPMSKWSLLNRLLVFFSGTQDARGIRQWNKVGRYPKQGSKAIHILAPSVKKKEADEAKEAKGTKEETTDGLGSDRENQRPTEDRNNTKFVHGFVMVPVFRLEDTDGKAIAYPDLTIPEFPLIQRAEDWGINLKAVGRNSYYYGAYSQKRQEIILASPEESVFFHELCHSAHHRLKGSLTPGQDWRQEIVAELGAIVLCKLVGKEPDKALGNGYRYISNYAEKAKISPLSAVVKVLSDTEKVLTLIMKGGEAYAVQTNSGSLEKRG